MNIMKISIIYGTARPDFPMIDLPNIHQFTPFLKSLQRQTFKDFEVIISDVLYEQRKYNFSRFNFPVKHLNPNVFSWALKKGLWGLQDGFNWGLVHAEGELLLWFGDCCELVNPDSLQLWWDWYMKGYFAQALVVYYKGNQPFFVDDAIKMKYAKKGTTLYYQPEIFKKHVKEGILKDVLKDSRWQYVEKSLNGIYPCGGELFYGYASSSLDAMLRVNGYDSNFDGSKSLGDVECGLRLERLGFQFVLDKRLWLVERVHKPIPPKVLWGSPKQEFRSNYSLMMLNKEKKLVRANSYKLSREELEWIIEHGTHWSVPRPKEGTYGYKLLMEWYNHPPIFDLRELRLDAV